jgi:hypothetical protein
MPAAALGMILINPCILDARGSVRDGFANPCVQNVLIINSE